MRLGLVALACLLLAPHAVASAPAPLAIVYDLATGAVHAGPLATAAPVLEADGCATAWPAKLTCRGVLGTHEAIDAPTSYIQSIWYPRQGATFDGGSFEFRLAWEGGRAGLRCHVPPTTEAPWAATCEELDETILSWEWRDEAWRLEGVQGATLVGSMTFAVVYKSH